MIHEMNLADRLNASVSRQRMSAEREGRESFDEQQLKLRSCHICGDPEDYCVPCETCHKPVCENCRLLLHGVSECLSCVDDSETVGGEA